MHEVWITRAGRPVRVPKKCVRESRALRTVRIFQHGKDDAVAIRSGGGLAAQARPSPGRSRGRTEPRLLRSSAQFVGKDCTVTW